MRILIGIPCFNEEPQISQTVHELMSELQHLTNSINIVVFDDASSDKSVQQAL